MPFNSLPFGLSLAAIDSGAATSFTIDSAFVAGVSGDALGVMHQWREAVSNQTVLLYVYITAVTGTPNSVTAYIYNGADDGENTLRPDIAEGVIYTSDVVDCSTTGWKVFTFTGVTRTISTTSWFLVTNTTGTPTSNYFDVQVRGALDSAQDMANNQAFYGHQSLTNTAGFSTDGTLAGGTSPTVVTYPSGASYGNPYVAAGAAHASNTNYRGNRFTPTEDMQVSGFFGIIDTNFTTMHVAQGASELLNLTVDETSQARSAGAFFAPITLTGGLAYDFLQKAGSADTFSATFTMGTSPPANVQLAGSPLTYVDGATLGSLTETTTTVYKMAIEISANPAIAGGGGMRLAGHGGLAS